MKMLHKPGKSCVERSQFSDPVTGRYRWLAIYQGGYLGTYETWSEAFAVAFGVVVIEWERHNKIKAMHVEEMGVVIPDERRLIVDGTV